MSSDAVASHRDVRPPSWGAIAVCIASAMLMAAVMAVAVAASAVATAPRRALRRRPRYVGAHAQGRVVS